MDRNIVVSDFPEISLFGDDKGIDASIELLHTDDRVFTYKFRWKSDGGRTPQAITLRWRMPCINVKGVWKSGGLHDKRLQYDWELEHVQSRISVNAPLIGVFGHNDENIATLACSDAINLLEMNALLREEDNHLYFHIQFFGERHPEIQEYEAELRFDLRSVSFAKALQETSIWWEYFDALKPCLVPELARTPLYSTWYNFHQNLQESILLEECAIAVKMGYKLIILDDGWQTMDSDRGYDYTGDWQPDRFPDLAGFVAKVHQLGMKFGLWFSVPFCGKKSKAYQRFRGKFLTENHRWAPVFDPRYPEVRAYLIDIYKNALIDYNLDAFKLDFIDDFRVYPETVLTKENGRDYANVNAAVDRLLTDVVQSLRAIKPDIAIEFRQKYVGPAMRKFGNMFRAFDCPNDPVSNRIRITDVKLLCGSSAVHSDPQTWHREEKVELAALQVLNGFFGVPQMSVHLRMIPQDHLDMIQFYTNYWTENADVILDGTFLPQKPLANYPILSVTKNDHQIIGVYENEVLELSSAKKIDFFNAKHSENLVVRNGGEKATYQVQVWNCTGSTEREEQIEIDKGLMEIPVKTSGMVRLQRI